MFGKRQDSPPKAEVIMKETLFLVSAAAIKPEVQKRLSDILSIREGGKTVAYTSTVGNYGQNPFVPNQIWQWFEDRDYILKPITLDLDHSLEAQSTIQAADIFVFNGGNPFQLLRLVRETGVDQILIEKVRAGYPYIGSSAAAMLVGPTIESTFYHPEGGGNTAGITDFTGLNLIPDIVWPHYRVSHDPCVQQLSTAFRLFQVKTIGDRQAIVYQDDKSEIIGSAEPVLPEEVTFPKKPPRYSTP